MSDIIERLRGDLKEYQSIPFWSWNDRLDPQELRRQIGLMKQAGIGGFFMHARGGLTTPYLGEEWFEATAACIDEAKKQNMDAWCYDENGWPSGFAGMKLLEDENNWEHFITCETIDRFDEGALAVYELKDGHLTRLSGAKPGVKEYITVYEKKNSSVVDILNPDIVRKFLDETHEKYYARFGDSFGKVMMGFFTDEPQFFRWDTAYTPCAIEAYRTRYGEELLDGLGALFVECDESDRFRYRYWKLMNDLYTDSFAKQIYDWCEAHHCQLTGHTIEERNLFGQMMCTAGVMPFYEYEHKPGMDWLGRGIATEAAPRQVSSVAQQLGKKHVLTETFACAGWDVTPTELKHIAEWQYVSGVNQMCQHLYPYSIRGQRKRDYPAFYSEHNTWTGPGEFKHFNDYFTALGYMLSESREEANTAVIHPIHSAYLTFKRNDPHCVDELNARFEALIEKLGMANIGHHYIDETLLSKYGSVDGAKLVMGQCAYTTVVIPDMPCLDESTARLLREFVNNGGRVYLQGAAPYLVEGEKADLSFLRSNITFEDMIDEAYAIDRRDTPVRSTFRRAEFGDFLFAVNLSGEETVDVTYAFRAKGAKRFDLEERAYRPLHYVPTDDGIRVPLKLRPYESVVIMLDDNAACAPDVARKAPDRALPLEADIESISENTLTLDYAALSFDGITYTKPLPIMAVNDMLLRGKKDRKVFLKYTFDVKERPASLRLECERMNAVSVRLNGVEIALKTPGSFDRAFVTADIMDLLREGENEIVFEIDYAQSKEVYDVFNGVYYEHSDGTESLINCLSYLTDIEAVYLRGEFGVEAEAFEPRRNNTLITKGGFGLTKAKSHVAVNRMTESGYPFFGGSVTLKIPFSAKGDEETLRLTGRYTLARVCVNGGAPITLMFTDTADIKGLVKPGENELTIELFSSYRNVFGPFHFAPAPEPMAVGPDLFSGFGGWNDEGQNKYYTDTYAFTRFGLDEILIG